MRAGFRISSLVRSGLTVESVRRRASLPDDRLTVIGIDDWAGRRNHRYGTIVCDLKRRRIVKLLPNREMATVEAWLADHPEIGIVSRDRGGGYGEAIAMALPHSRCSRRHHGAMVERPDRGPDRQAQAGQAADVRPRNAKLDLLQARLIGAA